MMFARRALLLGATAALTGCDRLARNDQFRRALFSAENFHKWAQRSLMARDALAQRGERPFIFTNLRSGDGVQAVVQFIREQGLLDSAAAT